MMRDFTSCLLLYNFTIQDNHTRSLCPVVMLDISLNKQQTEQVQEIKLLGVTINQHHGPHIFNR